MKSLHIRVRIRGAGRDQAARMNAIETIAQRQRERWWAAGFREINVNGAGWQPLSVAT